MRLLAENDVLVKEIGRLNGTFVSSLLGGVKDTSYTVVSTGWSLTTEILKMLFTLGA